MDIIRTHNNGDSELNSTFGFVHLNEINTLRTDLKAGSLVEAIEDRSKWVLDHNKIWCKLGSADTSGLSYVVVDELPDPSSAVEGVMYLYKEDGETYYNIYFLSNGSLEKIGGTETDFGNIATKEELENYLPLAGGTMSGNINMQGNTVGNTNYDFDAAHGLYSKIAGTTTHYSGTGFQIQTNENTTVGVGGIYVDPVSFTYDFVDDGNNSMQWTGSAGAFLIQGQNNFNFHLLNDEMLYKDSTGATEYRFNKTATYLLNGYNSQTGIAARAIEQTTGGTFIYSDQAVQIFNGTKAGSKIGIACNPMGVALQNGSKSLLLDSDGSMLSPNTTFTKDQELVTKKYVDEAIAAAIANL